MVRVTIWNEFRHERENASCRRIYPDGIHATLARALGGFGLEVRTATLDEPEHGLTEAVLDGTDTLLWWGHRAHEAVDEVIVDRVQRRVLAGMGFVALHSAHFSRPFRRLMGTSCTLAWRVAGERERLWVIAPEHPIAQGLPASIELAEEEMYGEPFGIPEPERLVLISWFKGGEVFRSGACWTRGRGRIAYLRPGHETFPTYHQPAIQRLVANAARWAAPEGGQQTALDNRRQEPCESLG